MDRRYPAEVSSYANSLKDQLKSHILYQENRDYADHNPDEFNPTTFEKLVKKIEEKLSFWVGTYPTNLEVLQLAYEFAKHRNNKEDMDLFRLEIIEIDKNRMEKPTKERKRLAEDFYKKANQLKLEKNIVTNSFLGLISLLIIVLLLIFFFFPVKTLTSDQILIFIFTKVTVSFTIIMSILWIARFYNRRIHESVHLIEEYEHRALLFESFDNIKDILSEEMEKEYFQKMLGAIVETPTYALHRKKADKIPTELIELAKIISNK